MNEPRWLSVQFPHPPREEAVPGGTMAWVESGSGRDVVCVHGNPTWSFLWRKVIAALDGQRLRVLAPDLLGCGRSSKPRAVAWHTLDRHAAALSAWMEARRLVDPILVGTGAVRSGCSPRLGRPRCASRRSASSTPE